MNEKIYVEIEGKSNVQERIEGYLVSDIELCVQKNSSFYLERFSKLPKHNVNEMALVFTGEWMVYRHMWREFIITLLLAGSIIFATAPYTVKLLNSIGYNGKAGTVILACGYLIIICPIIGFLGDSLYWKKIERELNRFNRKDSISPLAEAERAELQKRTNSSGIYILLANLIAMIISRIIVELFVIVMIFKLGI